ncbi:hypothetical protein [Actinoplanes couchii]|uniref:Lipoprotein n=1 Tax=Actinoplanes couchii TaxID=403638 RepID=A0ABQ3XI32_9ACTN|nr:hypothetical protein [Actinoplanes couchii]MDR6324592.1 hypothetical protein [Actinoplanes couchii]GID58144.1 hypothetical protein Aco03nite_065480 [Actinoplanes couchii]
MRDTYRLGAGVVALCAAVLLPSTPALAADNGGGTTAVAFAPTVCEPNFKAYKVTSVKTPWTVTHASIHENYSGSTEKRTAKASKQTVLKASLSVTSGVEAKAGVIFAKVDSKVEFTVAGEGQKTKSSSVTVTSTMKSGRRYVFFAGRRKVTGEWTMTQCNSRGTASSVKGRGKVATFDKVEGTGSVWCGAKPKAGTLAAKAKKLYC